MYTLTNQVLSIQVAPKGAELQSIINKQNNLEYLWSGDARFWGKKSPVLFPIVGELKNKSYTFNGNQYNLSRHGFAREMEFEVSASDENSLTFSIRSNETTLPVFPFHFVFSVKYTLIDSMINVNYIVENTGNETMYFSVGGHPAFKVPLVDNTSFEDYYLVFNEKETTGRYPLSSKGLIETTPASLLNNENILPLKKDLFSADAIVLKGLKSTSVSIESAQTTHGIRVSFKAFPYLGIWETKGGDFVCIEPWYGIADSVNASGNLEEKEGINKLLAAEIFSASFYIEIF